MSAILANRVGIGKRVGTLYCQIMDSETLHALARRNRQDKARERGSYATLVDAIWRAQDEGWRQVDIVDAVGLTRERVRQICDPDYREKRQAAPPR
jgi:hypothetical protein